MEVGIPAMGAEEQSDVRAVARLGLKARVITWCRMREDDLSAALACGVQMVNMSIPLSDQQLARKLHRDRAWALAEIERMVRSARQARAGGRGRRRNSSRAEPDFLIAAAKTAEAAGARRFRFADTLGVMDPFTTLDVFRKLRAQCRANWKSMPMTIWLATANSLAAIMGGATHVTPRSTASANALAMRRWRKS